MGMGALYCLKQTIASRRQLRLVKLEEHLSSLIYTIARLSRGQQLYIECNPTFHSILKLDPSLNHSVRGFFAGESCAADAAALFAAASSKPEELIDNCYKLLNSHNDPFSELILGFELKSWWSKN